MHSSDTKLKKVRIKTLYERKAAAEPIAILTAYDASMAALIDQAGVDAVLVGDSLGMVIQGCGRVEAVTMEQMIYHCECVRRGVERALLIGDMPFQSYAFEQQAVANAARLMSQGGVDMVKLEGAGPTLEVISALTQRDIPVCGHLGLTPQSVAKLSGYRIQGRNEEAAAVLREDARRLVDAGVDLLVLECVPEALAEQITADLSVPVIGIGAGRKVDGQVLVSYDVLGISKGRIPSFARCFASGQDQGIAGAMAAYVDAVKQRGFPNASETIA